MINVSTVEIVYRKMFPTLLSVGAVAHWWSVHFIREDPFWALCGPQSPAALHVKSHKQSSADYLAKRR